MAHLMRTIAAALFAGLLGASCGDAGRSPVSSNTPSQAIPAGSGGRIVLASGGLRAGKRLGPGEVQSKTDTEWISNRRGGKLRVQFNGSDDDDDDDDRQTGRVGGTIRVQNASLRIEKNSIGGVAPDRGDSYRITMTVESGTTLDDVNVTFAPTGMEFSPPAELDILLAGKADSQDISAYHVSADGTVTRIHVHAEPVRGGFRIRVNVPGFSVYSWDDGE